ncbi:MAG: phosphate propanoyltransferase [Aminipila sp.]
MEHLAMAVTEILLSKGIIQVETSARHVHLSKGDVEQLFGVGYILKKKRNLSQKGQYVCEEKVTLVGSKGEKKLSVLGPTREKTQIEISQGDCLSLGMDAPIRLSGDLLASGSAVLKGPNGVVALTEGAIIAKAHIHMTPELAEKLGIRDRAKVAVELFTERPVLIKDVIVRVSQDATSKVHIDTDESNAAGCKGFTLGRIIQ